MSTLRVNTLQSTSTTDGGISIDTSGNVTLPANTKVGTQNLPSAGPLSNRNLVINGAMQVAQRGTQVTGVTTAAYLTCDRFIFDVGTLGTWTIDQDTNAPNGFSNSFKITCTTADASPAANDYLLLLHRIEAQNLQLLNFGTADAQSTTVSFWVRSNKTGNATFVIRQDDNSSKQVSFQYSISSADTWEYKTITIPGDTAGVINNDNGIGFGMEWWLNSGSNFTSGSHQTTWTTAANADRNPSNLGVGGATNDYFQITGVQLEVGSVATPFEHRSYGDELARCQRYYETTYNTGLAVGSVDDTGAWIDVTLNASDYYDFGRVTFKVTKRANPTVTAYSVGTGASGKVRQQGATDLNCTASKLGMSGCRLSTSGATTNNYHQAHLTIEAEL